MELADGAAVGTAPAESKTRPTTKMRQFLVLMWKHFTVRKARFIATPCEMLLPCIALIVVYFIGKKYLTPDRTRNVQPKLNIYHPERLATLIMPTILYSPDSELANALMDEVGKRLKIDRITNETEMFSVKNGFYASTNDSGRFVDKFTENLQDDFKSAIVIFEGLTEKDWPDKLNYTVKMRDFSEMAQLPNLQWSIDSSYLTLSTGRNISQRVWLQKFPYRQRQLRGYFMKQLAQQLQHACAYSLLPPFAFLLTRLLVERATGVQELVRMVGVSNNVFIYSHFVNMIPVGVLFAAVGAGTGSALVENTDGFLIFVMLLLHFCSIMALAFLCSYLTKSGRYSASLSVLSFVVLWVPAFLYWKLPRSLLLLCGLLPHVPMYWFWYEGMGLLDSGGSLNWTTMWTSHSVESGSVALAFFMMCLQTAIFLMLAWYLSMVIPGKYGVGQPCNFLLKRSYWVKTKAESLDDPEENEDEAVKDEYFEELAKDAPRRDVGIRINNVYKKFGKDYALSNVSFNVYKDEITVLLGHNGAGKTTLMSIITGMMSSSAGKVFVGGLDVSSAGGEFRRQLGLCPQHNLFFPDLSVLQHLVFFAMLKGGTYKQARESSMVLLSKLGIAEKANNKSGELSGGMKRRLQLACALAGGASVLILDEPTSGLDVETRRQLWDLLLTLRGNRTVLLTTHFMEEADALGDRVAALHKGRLRCHATPMYLKKNIGTGYRLSLTTTGLPREGTITQLISSVLGDALLKESSLNSISFNLPAQHSHRFPQLFAALETNRSELGIDSIGVGVSSLEDVFLKLCSDVDTKFTQETVDTSLPEPTYTLLSGWQLFTRQVWALMRRQALYILAKKTSFFILQMLVPLGLIFLLTFVLNGTTSESESESKILPITMNLDVFGTSFGRKVLYNAPEIPEDAIKKIASNYNDVPFENVPYTTGGIEKVLKLAAENEDLTQYKKYQIAVEIIDSDVLIHYNNKIEHTRAVAVNLVSNMLAEAAGRGGSGGPAITTVYHPVKKVMTKIYNRAQNIRDSKPLVISAIWTIFVVFIIMGVLMNTVSLPITERISGTRHIHIMSGCSPVVHWLVTLLFHVLLYTAVLLLPTAGIVMVDKDLTLNQPAFIGALILILMLGTAAFLALGYLVSFSSEERRAGLLLVVIMLVLGVMPGTAYSMTKNLEEIGSWRILFTIPTYLFPSATMTSALISASQVARLNAYCNLNIDQCPFVDEYHGYYGLDTEKCCAQKKGYLCYICTEGNAPGAEITLLVIQLLVYIALVILTQYGIFNSLYDRLVNMNYRPAFTCSRSNNDEVTRAEKIYVHGAINHPPNRIDDAMLVNDLHKSYFSILKPRTPCNAVKGISFSVKKGECFGLLGVNGAGKSTTFKMISGEECPTRGGVFANGQHLKWPRSAYLQSLGYCPQFFGLDMFLTGRENLSLLLTLRGLAQADVDAKTDSWIEIVGLERYSNTPVSGYSGGCTRRLATAAALSSGAAVTLLDEPTAGVDVSARRRVWQALRQGLRNNRAVIITSHSMDEMEALCDRIAIMSGGSLGALGSACSLRAAHAAGHALVLKLGCSLAVGDVANDHEPAALQSLKASLHQKFNCTLKDEHKTMLHYHINESMCYSSLFSALEQLKLEFPQLVEDYSVTETTLEEVFLSFAQPAAQQPARGTPAAIQSV